MGEIYWIIKEEKNIKISLSLYAQESNIFGEKIFIHETLANK
jgi:hypothetical protein